MALDNQSKQQVSFDETLKRRNLELIKRGAARHTWRRVEADQDPNLETTISHDSRPLAQIGERCPPESAARSNNSSMTLPLKLPAPPAHDNPHTPAEEQAQDQDQETTRKTREEQNQDQDQEPRTQDAPRKLIATIPEALLSQLRATCEVKASTSLLGRIHGKHPGLKSLTAWAKNTLHSSLTLLSLKANNLFEVTFAHEEGRLHALK